MLLLIVKDTNIADGYQYISTKTLDGKKNVIKGMEISKGADGALQNRFSKWGKENWVKYKKKSQPEKNQEPAFHPLFVNPKKVEFENVFLASD